MLFITSLRDFKNSGQKYTFVFKVRITYMTCLSSNELLTVINCKLQLHTGTTMFGFLIENNDIAKTYI